jgi:hypothetical protein
MTVVRCNGRRVAYKGLKLSSAFGLFGCGAELNILAEVPNGGTQKET